MSFLTYSVGAVLAIGIMAVVFLIWRAAQPSGSLGQMLRRTDKIPYHGEIDPRRFSDRDRD